MSERIIKSRGHVVAVELPDGMALLDTSKNIYYSLNGSGAVIWSLCEASTSKSALVKAITDKFSIDEKTAVSDIDAVVDDLVGKNLVEVWD